MQQSRVRFPPSPKLAFSHRGRSQGTTVMAKPSATDMIVLEGGDSVTEENKYCGESGKVDNIIWLTFTMCM